MFVNFFFLSQCYLRNFEVLEIVIKRILRSIFDDHKSLYN